MPLPTASVPIVLDRRKAHFLSSEIFAFPRPGKLDVSNAASFHCHGEDWHGIAGSLAARNGIETGAIDHLALPIEGFEQSRHPGGPPKGDRDGRYRLLELGSDWNRLRRHRANQPLVARVEVGEEHEHALSLRLLRFMGEPEYHSLFFPLREAVGVAVRQQGHALLEVQHHLLRRPGASRCADQQKRYGRTADHALAESRPDIVPVEEPNLAASIPIRCSIETNRLGSG